jgi:enoyl-CoA hydratase/carnithine racemase
MAYEDILYAVEDGVAIITLNRPDKLNAWRGQMDAEVRDAMAKARDDDGVRVIVLTGAGKGFCAGADMGMLQTIQGEASATGERSSRTSSARGAFDPNATADFQKEYSWLPSVPKPIIASINGAAAGLGLILSLYCDMRFAADTAKFTTAFSRRGLVAEHGISWLLPKLVGMGTALDLLFSARTFAAPEAREMGLVDRVYPAASLMDETLAYARMLASEVSPRSLREMKREVWNALMQPLGAAIEAANGDMPASFKSEDFREGVAHFVEKRKPRFTGR